MLSSLGFTQTDSVCKSGDDFLTAEAIRKVPLCPDSCPSSAVFSSGDPGGMWPGEDAASLWAFLTPASQPRGWDALACFKKWSCG